MQFFDVFILFAVLPLVVEPVFGAVGQLDQFIAYIGFNVRFKIVRVVDATANVEDKLLEGVLGIDTITFLIIN